MSPVGSVFDMGFAPIYCYNHICMKRSVAIWEIMGFIFVVLLGTALHFAFTASGDSLALAPFVPVNESVWEHLKLLFYPFLLFAAIEFRFVGKGIKNFWFAKGMVSLLGPLAIIAMFYSYVGLIGDNFLPADIGVFVIAAALSSRLGYNIMTHHLIPKRSRAVAIGIITLMVAGFIAFTFLPPENELFIDPLTGEYGIPR